MIKPLVCSLVIGALAACQSSGSVESSQAEAERVVDLSGKSALQVIPESGLGPQELAPGECGLFLWSQTDISKFIFFSEAQTGQATFAQGDLPVTLVQSNAGGDIFGQFNTLSSYQFEDGKTLSLDITPGEELEGGQRIEQGLITINTSDDWVTKLPVRGVRACKPEA